MLFSVSSIAAFAQMPAVSSSDPVVEDVFLARDDGTGKAGEVISVFNPNDIPIYCIVVLSKDGPVAVKMNLVAVKVNGVKPETKVVTTAYTTKQGEDRVNFRGRPAGQWVAGNYRIDVFVEGRHEKSINFDVKAGSVPAAATKFAPAKTRTLAAKRSN